MKAVSLTIEEWELYGSKNYLPVTGQPSFMNFRIGLLRFFARAKIVVLRDSEGLVHRHVTFYSLNLCLVTFIKVNQFYSRDGGLSGLGSFLDVARQEKGLVIIIGLPYDAFKTDRDSNRRILSIRSKPSVGTRLVDLKNLADNRPGKTFSNQWRRNFRKFQSLNLDIEIRNLRSDVSPNEKRLMYEQYRQFAARRGFQGPSIKDLSFLIEKMEGVDVFLISAKQLPTPLSDYLIICGNYTTMIYLIGISSDEGRRNCLPVGFMMASLNVSSKQGYQFFDLGGLNCNTIAGIRRFKEGIPGVNQEFGDGSHVVIF